MFYTSFLALFASLTLYIALLIEMEIRSPPAKARALFDGPTSDEEGAYHSQRLPSISRAARDGLGRDGRLVGR